MRVITRNTYNQRLKVFPFDRGHVFEVSLATAVKIIEDLYGYAFKPFNLQKELDKAYDKGLIPWQINIA